MAGVHFRIDLKDLARIRKRIAALGRFDARALLDAIGAKAESQTRRRLEEEKASPDGEPWPDVSPGYELWKRQRSSGGLLELKGRLLDSVQYAVTGPGSVEVGSNREYAAIHQFGGAEVGMAIPARPYLGLSAENEADLEALVTDYFESLLEAR